MVADQIFTRIRERHPPLACSGFATDTDEAEDRCFFIEAVNKSVHDAILNHNAIFLNSTTP